MRKQPAAGARAIEKPVGVIVAMPTRGLVSIETQQCLAKRMDGYPSWQEVAIRKPVDEARNELVGSIRRLKPRRFDFNPKYVLWVDDDSMWLEGSVRCAIKTLENRPDIDLLFGYFCSRDENRRAAQIEYDAPRSVYWSPGDTEPKRIWSSGFHWVMHRRSLLNRLEAGPFSTQGLDVEDLSFCNRAKVLGLKLFYSPLIWVFHVESEIGAAYLPNSPRYRLKGLDFELDPGVPEIKPRRDYGSSVTTSFEALRIKGQYEAALADVQRIRAEQAAMLDRWKTLTKTFQAKFGDVADVTALDESAASIA